MLGALSTLRGLAALKGVAGVDGHSERWTVIVTLPWTALFTPASRRRLAWLVDELLPAGVVAKYRWLGIEVKP